MSNQIIMLGTGSAMVTKCYNTCFILKCGKENLLVDAGGGNGILSQIDKSPVDWTDLKYLFVTHAHTDHILGVVWVIRKISSLMLEDKYQGKFTIMCHNEAVKAIYDLCRATLAPKFLNCIDKGIIIHEVIDGEIMMINGLHLNFFDIHSDKTKQFGFNATLNGKTKIACLGDEPYNPVCKKYVYGYDYLMCEAFCLYSQKEQFKPYEKFHSTALDAGKLAEDLKIKNLILYHTEDQNLDTRKISYTSEVSKVFSGNIYVPNDLEIIDL